MVSVEAVTGFGAAALHGIFLNGQGSGELLAQMLSRTSPRDCWHADLLDEDGEVIDDVVCLRWTSSEEAFLLTTHGKQVDPGSCSRSVCGIGSSIMLRK